MGLTCSSNARDSRYAQKISGVNQELGRPKKKCNGGFGLEVTSCEVGK